MPDKNPKTSTRRLSRHVLRTICWFLGISCFFFLAIYITLNHFGEHLVRSYLQHRILAASDGVYRIDFDRFSFNMFSGRTTVTDFTMIPDELRYQELRGKGEVRGTLYSLNYAKLTLNDLHILEMFLKRTIHLREIELERPVISFVAYPDSAARKRGRFQQIYRDIYPVLSILFSEVKVDSIKVLEGSFSGKRTWSSGGTSEQDWLYSVILRDFDLNSDNRLLEKRVFYSRDVELRIHKFRYFLADSLYILTADEIGFSLSGSRLFGKGLSLTPDFRSYCMDRTTRGYIYQVYIPEFSIDRVDLYEAFLEKKISVGAIRIDEPDVRMFHHKKAGPARLNDRAGLNVATLYSVISGKIREVSVDTLLLRRADFSYYPDINSIKPELTVERADLSLEGFRLDSLAHLDTTKIFYARDIELILEGFTLALKDKLHSLHAARVIVSTHDSLIDLRETRLYPSTEIDPSVRYRSNSFLQLLFPHVRLEKVDLFRMFNSRRLELRTITVSEPDVTVVQYREKLTDMNGQSTRETFPEKLNLIRHLVIPYMVSMDVRRILVSNARVSFRDEKDGISTERISGLADLKITGFEVDTLTYGNPLKFLSGLEFDLEVKDFHYLSPDSMHRINIREFIANTLLQDLEINGFEMLSTSPPRPGSHHPSTFSARFSSLSVDKLDYQKWLRERWFNAGQIRLVEPEIVVRSVRKKRESTLNEPFAETDEEVNKIEIGNFLIRRGLFDLSEQSQASAFSLLIRNFDFQVSGLLFDLSHWDDGIRIFRYDHLSLIPDPGMPVIVDSLYTVGFSSILSDSYPPDLAISQLHLSPVHNPGRDIRTDLTTEISVPSILVRKLDLEKALFERDLRVDEIVVTHPEINFVGNTRLITKDQQNRGRNAGHPELKTPFHYMDIGYIALTGGTVHYSYRENDKSADLTLDRITAGIKGFRYDSIRASEKGVPLFYCDDIDLQTGGFSMLTKDSMNTLSLGGIHLSTGREVLTLDSVELIPTLTDYEYSRKLGYQTDRIELTVGKITLDRLDLNSLAGERKVRAGCATIEGLVMDDYRDKRVEFPEWKRPPMIQQAIRRIPFPVSFDTVRLTGGRITYREQTGDEAGMVLFDRMNLLARNFTSDTTSITPGNALTADGSVLLMGKAPAYGSFVFPLNSLADTFFFSGNARQIDLTMFNPMIERITPFRIGSGIVDSLKVHRIRGNSSYATGLMDIYYHGLTVELLKKDKDFLDRVGVNILQLLADLVIPSENPGSFGKYRSGYIWSNRDMEKGFFNFYWKSLLSGLKSSAGFNNKEQKQEKKGKIIP